MKKRFTFRNPYDILIKYESARIQRLESPTVS